MGLFRFRQNRKMPFQRFVEIGRIAVIVDVVDQNRVLLDGPGLERQTYRIKSLHLTKFACKFGHSAKTSVVKKAWEDEEISKKFEASSWGQRMKKSVIRANLSDFDKFKLNKLKIQRRRIINQKINQLKKK